MPTPESRFTPDIDFEEPEGLDNNEPSWGDYPLEEVLIRNDNRTIFDIIRRIRDGRYVMDPDFQRDFIWREDKQSKLIESVVMRIPLPVVYLAEDDEGRMVVVDGLQRLSTFARFVNGKLKLQLSDRPELNGKTFAQLSSKLQNRIEDCNLICYIIDSKVPERARLDIFERVNGGIPLSRQQMRNSLFMGPATRFLKEAARTDLFLQATGSSLNMKTMRDREFVNRFCAFRILELDSYRGNEMDEFLARSLQIMNRMSSDEIQQLGSGLQMSLSNNFVLFERHAFRKYTPGQSRRSVLNASLWDVMSTGLSHYTEIQVKAAADNIRTAYYQLLAEEDFNAAITYGTNDRKRVSFRFERVTHMLEEILGAHQD